MKGERYLCSYRKFLKAQKKSQNTCILFFDKRIVNLLFFVYHYKHKSATKICTSK